VTEILLAACHSKLTSYVLVLDVLCYSIGTKYPSLRPSPTRGEGTFPPSPVLS